MTNRLRNLSIEKELVTVKMLLRRTTERDRDRMTTRVFPLLLPRPDRAIRQSFPPSVVRFSFRLPFAPSVYRTASTGDTRAAIRAGFLVEMPTVTRVKRTAPRKMRGLRDTSTSPPA